MFKVYLIQAEFYVLRQNKIKVKFLVQILYKHPKNRCIHKAISWRARQAKNL